MDIPRWVKYRDEIICVDMQKPAAFPAQWDPKLGIHVT